MKKIVLNSISGIFVALSVVSVAFSAHAQGFETFGDGNLGIFETTPVSSFDTTSNLGSFETISNLGQFETASNLGLFETTSNLGQFETMPVNPGYTDYIANPGYTDYVASPGYTDYVASPGYTDYTYPYDYSYPFVDAFVDTFPIASAVSPFSSFPIASAPFFSPFINPFAAIPAVAAVAAPSNTVVNAPTNTTINAPTAACLTPNSCSTTIDDHSTFNAPTTINAPTTVTTTGAAPIAAVTPVTVPFFTAQAYPAPFYPSPVYQAPAPYVAPAPIYQAPASPYVALTQIPYTGFDFGPLGNALYWMGLVGFALAAGYLLVYYLPTLKLRQAGLPTLSLRQAVRGGISVVKSENLATKRAEAVAPVAEKMFSAPFVNPFVKRLTAVRTDVATRDSMKVVPSQGNSAPRIVISRS